MSRANILCFWIPQGYIHQWYSYGRGMLSSTGAWARMYHGHPLASRAIRGSEQSLHAHSPSRNGKESLDTGTQAPAELTVPSPIGTPLMHMIDHTLHVMWEAWISYAYSPKLASVQQAIEQVSLINIGLVRAILLLSNNGQSQSKNIIQTGLAFWFRIHRLCRICNSWLAARSKIQQYLLGGMIYHRLSSSYTRISFLSPFNHMMCKRDIGRCMYSFLMRPRTGINATADWTNMPADRKAIEQAFKMHPQ